MFEKLGGRKLIFMVLAMAVGVVVDLKTDNGLSTNLKDLIIYVGAIYTVGNVGSKVSTALKEKNTKEVQLQVDQIAQEMRILNESQNTVFQTLQTNNQATGEILNRISGNK